MKNRQSHENQPNKRMLKHGVSRKWNSSIFFQIGLIVGLLTVFFVLESTLGTKPEKIAIHEPPLLEEPAFTRYTLEKDVPKTSEKQEPKKEEPRLDRKITTSEPPTILDDTSIKDETPIGNSEINPDDTITEGSKATNSVPDTSTKNYNTLSVEKVPVFPGCEQLGNKQEQIDCFSEKVSRFVQRKFDTSKFSGRYKPGSKHVIYVQFTVLPSGKVGRIKTRASDIQLMEEAERVVARMPDIVPGKMGAVAVPVTYTFPIQFVSE